MIYVKPLGVPYTDKTIQNKFRYGSWTQSRQGVWHLYNETVYRMGIYLVNDKEKPRYGYVIMRKHMSFHVHPRFDEEVTTWHSYAEVKESGLTICEKCAKIWKERYGAEYKALQKRRKAAKLRAKEQAKKRKAKEPSWRDC